MINLMSEQKSFGRYLLFSSYCTMQSLVENSKVINTCLTKKRKTKEGGKAEQKPTQKTPGLLGFNAVTALETYILYNVGTST